MKRLTALLIALFLLCVCLGACSAQKEKTQKVGICIPEDSSVDTAYLVEKLEKMGCEVVIFHEDPDQEKQTQRVHRLFEEKYDLVIVEPYFSDAVENILNSDKRKKIPVLFINYYGTPPEALENVCFLTSDPTEMGKTQASSLSELPDAGDLNGDGTVCYAVLAGEPDNEEVRLQAEGITAGLLDATQLTTVHSSNAAEGVKSLCDDLLATYGRDLELLVCTDSSLTVAAAEAFAESGRIPGEDLYLIGGGESPELMKLIEDGTVCATAAPQRRDDQNLILEIASAMLGGDGYRDTYTLTYSITK